MDKVKRKWTMGNECEQKQMRETAVEKKGKNDERKKGRNGSFNALTRAEGKEGLYAFRSLGFNR